MSDRQREEYEKKYREQYREEHAKDNYLNYMKKSSYPKSRLSSRILGKGSVRFKVSSKFEGTALILFNNWKAALSDALVETAGYDLEYAERILGPTPHVFENRFENEWSPEDVAQEVIQAVDKEA